MENLNNMNVNNSNAELNKTTKSDIFKIDPRNIVVKEGFNSRRNFGDIDELAAQIKEQGVLNPITVQPFKDENGVEKYRLVDGERRYRAVMKLINEQGVDIKRIQALFLSKSCTEKEMLIQQAMRNEGKPFSEYEYAHHARKLRDICGMTNKEIADALGKNVGMVSYWFQLLELKPELQDMLDKGLVTAVDIRKMLQANKKDEDAVYNELKDAKEKIEKETKKEVKKINLKNLDINSRTIVFKDSKNIKYGLRLLFTYIDKYKNAAGENEIETELDIKYLLGELEKDRTITEVFDEMRNNLYSEKAVG